jgi:DNA-damage-inducible protein D
MPNEELPTIESPEAGVDPEFEAFGHDNGFHYWWASDLARFLGYVDVDGIRKPVAKAMQVCVSLNVSLTANVEPARRVVDGRSIEDYKLSRFACYLTAMNGDVRKPQVARAQAYFVTLAEACSFALTEKEGVERVHVRSEITDGERSLAGTAKRAGVSEFGLFQNAGYRGLYNMNLQQLKRMRHIPLKRSPLDFMGKAELAANLFRITQTDERIRNNDIRGQRPCEQAAEQVGARVRSAMLEMGGRAPEILPKARDIKTVQAQIKSTQKDFKRLDKAGGPPVPVPED